MPDAPTPDELAALRERHRPGPLTPNVHYSRLCECGQPWPCDAARLLALHDADVAEIRRLEQDAGALTGIPMSPIVQEHIRLLAERDEARAALAALRAEHDALLARAAHVGMFPAETAAVVAAARAWRAVWQLGEEGHAAIVAFDAAVAALDAATQQA